MDVGRDYNNDRSNEHVKRKIEKSYSLVCNKRKIIQIDKFCCVKLISNLLQNGRIGCLWKQESFKNCFNDWKLNIISTHPEKRDRREEIFTRKLLLRAILINQSTYTNEKRVKQKEEITFCALGISSEFITYNILRVTNRSCTAT